MRRPAKVRRAAGEVQGVGVEHRGHRLGDGPRERRARRRSLSPAGPDGKRREAREIGVAARGGRLRRERVQDRADVVRHGRRDEPRARAVRRPAREGGRPGHAPRAPHDEEPPVRALVRLRRAPREERRDVAHGDGLARGGSDGSTKPRSATAIRPHRAAGPRSTWHGFGHPNVTVRSARTDGAHASASSAESPDGRSTETTKARPADASPIARAGRPSGATRRLSPVPKSASTTIVATASGSSSRASFTSRIAPPTCSRR